MSLGGRRCRILVVWSYWSGPGATCGWRKQVRMAGTAEESAPAVAAAARHDPFAVAFALAVDSAAELDDAAAMTLLEAATQRAPAVCSRQS